MTHYFGNDADVLTLSTLLNRTASVNVQVNGACLCELLLARKDTSAHNISLKCSVLPLLHVKAIFHIFPAVNI